MYYFGEVSILSWNIKRSQTFPNEKSKKRILSVKGQNPLKDEFEIYVYLGTCKLTLILHYISSILHYKSSLHIKIIFRHRIRKNIPNLFNIGGQDQSINTELQTTGAKSS